MPVDPDAGESHGLGGPALLDYFYLAQRFPYRSGLGARTGRASACATPGVIRAAFDLSPEERISAKLHSAVIAQLVPGWKRIDFFAGDTGAMPVIARTRIWERDNEAASFEEMLAAPEMWDDIFDVERVRSMWDEVRRRGSGSADYEHVFDRVVWKVGFDAHLRRLGLLATDR